MLKLMERQKMVRLENFMLRLDPIWFKILIIRNIYTRRNEGDVSTFRLLGKRLITESARR